jgi:hypothetical protein
MNTDGMLVEQAARNKAQNPTAKVFVYADSLTSLSFVFSGSMAYSRVS